MSEKKNTQNQLQWFASHGYIITKKEMEIARDPTTKIFGTIVNTCFLKHLCWRFFIYPRWSSNRLLPAYGNSNRFNNYTYRFWIYFVSNHEKELLIKKIHK